jgi:hypothetical protein
MNASSPSEPPSARRMNASSGIELSARRINAFSFSPSVLRINGWSPLVALRTNAGSSFSP